MRVPPQILRTASHLDIRCFDQGVGREEHDTVQPCPILFNEKGRLLRGNSQEGGRRRDTETPRKTTENRRKPGGDPPTPLRRPFVGRSADLDGYSSVPSIAQSKAGKSGYDFTGPCKVSWHLLTNWTCVCRTCPSQQVMQYSWRGAYEKGKRGTDYRA